MAQFAVYQDTPEDIVLVTPEAPAETENESKESLNADTPGELPKQAVRSNLIVDESEDVAQSDENECEDGVDEIEEQDNSTIDFCRSLVEGMLLASKFNAACIKSDEVSTEELLISKKEGKLNEKTIAETEEASITDTFKDEESDAESTTSSLGKRTFAVYQDAEETSLTVVSSDLKSNNYHHKYQKIKKNALSVVSQNVVSSSKAFKSIGSNTNTLKPAKLSHKAMMTPKYPRPRRRTGIHSTCV
jgi:hypothetical protein